MTPALAKRNPPPPHVSLPAFVTITCLTMVSDYHARIDKRSLSTVRNANSLIPLTSPALTQPSILRNKRLTLDTANVCKLNDGQWPPVSYSKPPAGVETLSPQLFRLGKSESLPFSPSQVCGCHININININIIVLFPKNCYSGKNLGQTTACGLGTPV